MATKPQWFVNARRKHYKSLEEWVEAANKLGWDITYYRCKNWETTGVLPSSLTPENYKVIAQTLGLTMLEVLSNEGFEIDMLAGDLVIPPVAVDFVRKLTDVPEDVLESVVPALEAQLEAMLKLTRH